jgi:sugar transferase (PEP-CTERM system associated)
MPVFFLRYLAFQKVGAIVFEHALLITCVLLNLWARGPFEPTVETILASFCRAFVVAVTFQLFLHLKDSYEFGTKPFAPRFIWGFDQALVFACTLVFTVNLLIPDVILRRDSLARTLISISLVLTTWHVFLRWYFGIRPRQSNMLIIGTGPLARALATEILRHPEFGLSVRGFVDDNPALVGVSIVNPKVLGLNHELRAIVAEKKIDRIVVETRDRRGRLPVDELLELKMGGVGVEEATSVYERVTGKIAIENLKPSWMVFGEGFEVSRRILVQRQIVSFSVALLLLLLFAPLFPLIALLIKLDSEGSVFFRQERVGQNGKTFTLLKFRSMRQDAERDTGPVWAKPEDKRVTRLGKYLRRTRLDEIPQLLNVLKGEMTLIGPRPERPNFVQDLSNTIPFYYLRHSVKPGITGWAQINYRYGSSLEDAVEKLQYDLFYIKNISWALDLLIILNTVKTVLVRKGS